MRLVAGCGRMLTALPRLQPDKGKQHHHHHHHFIRQKNKYIKTRKKNTVGKTYQAQRALTTK